MSELPGRLVLLGHPVSHSLSPAFQNAALRRAGIPLEYEALDVPPVALESTLAEARRGRWVGNVTVPHKAAVFSACDAMSPEARRVGAVNAFRVEGRRLIGHNTDVQGFKTAAIGLLRELPRGVRVGIIGAGGAAAAALAAISDWPGASALVANRDAGRRATLLARFGSIASASDVGTIGREADIVVNATSLGLRADDPLPIEPHLLRQGSVVLDLVYSPNETRLVRAARAAGFRAADGLSMLWGQGVGAFEWWFNRAPDAALMWQTLQATRSAVP
jgi:shikimate dehydrogenase